jgi:hypothetical protein
MWGQCSPRMHRTTKAALLSRTTLYTGSMPGLRKNWKDTPEQTHKVPDVDDRVFDIYFEWLYSRMASIATNEVNFLEELIKAYAFGMRIDDVQFREFTLQVIIEQMQDTSAHINANHVTMAYQMTAGPCSLRELLVNIYKMLGPEDDVSDDFWGSLPSLFLRDLFETFTEDSRAKGTQMRSVRLQEIKTSLVLGSLDASQTDGQISVYVSAIGLGQEEMTAN